jgi:hypothetical protein
VTSNEMRMNSGCAVPWAASEPLNDEQQDQLKSNGPADINTNIDGRTRPAGQEALMVFIKTGDHQGAKNRQNRGAPPEGPVFDGHSVKRLPPTVEKSETDQSVTDKVAGLTDEMMYLLPVRRGWRTKEMHPQRIQPSASVRRRHRGGGLKSDHQNAQHGWHPVQYPVHHWVQPEMIHISHYKCPLRDE